VNACAVITRFKERKDDETHKNQMVVLDLLFKTSQITQQPLHETHHAISE